LGWPFLSFAVLGVILAAVYLLRMFGMSFMGDVTHEENKKLSDLSMRESTLLVLLLIPSVVIGFFPNLFFDSMQESIADVGFTVAQYVAAH
jgi:NADH-quinone oxidoreductase subunit M